MTREYERYLDEHRERILSTLDRFVAIPSVSTDGDGIARAARFLEEELRGRGWDVAVHETGGRPIVLATLGPEEAELGVLIYGHYDVFPVEDADRWDTEPFTATVDGDRIYGRGTGDNKGQLLAHVEGLEMVRELYGEPPVRIRLLIEGEEETGSRSLPGFIEAHRDELRVDVCFYSDGPMFPGDQPVLLCGVRGALCLELVARGARRVLHSGNFGGIAPRPTHDLVHLLARMTDRLGTLTVPGALAGVPEATASERAAIAALPFDAAELEREMGVPPVGDGSAAGAYERLLLKPAINVASLSAGFTGDGIKPVIPHEAVAKVDVRLVGDQDPDEVFERVEELVRAEGFDGVTCRKLVSQPPSKTPIDHPWIPVVREAVAAGFGREPLLVPSLAATTPDYVFTKLLGIPSFVVPYAPYDENNHAPNESTKVSCLFGGIKTTANLFKSLADGRALPDPRLGDDQGETDGTA